MYIELNRENQVPATAKEIRTRFTYFTTICACDIKDYDGLYVPLAICDTDGLGEAFKTARKKYAQYKHITYLDGEDLENSRSFRPEVIMHVVIPDLPDDM